MGVQREKDGKQHPRATNQHGMVDFSVVLADDERNGDTSLGIGVHIADIVDIEHTNAEKTDGTGRQQQPPAKCVAHNEISTHNRNKAEKYEDEQIAPTAITVRLGTERVAHGCDYGGSTQEQQYKGLRREQRTVRVPNHQCAEKAATEDGGDNEATEVPHRQQARLERVVRTPGVAAGIGTAFEVTEFVGKVGEDLQKDGGKKRKNDSGGGGLAVGCAEEKSEQDTGEREGKCAQPHRFDNIFRFIHFQSNLGTQKYENAGKTH